MASPLAAAVLFLGAILAPAASQAGHITQVFTNPSLSGVVQCYDCHTLNGSDAEPGTDDIYSFARTLPTMRANSGGSAPADFGCTFCHFTSSLGAMKDIISHFGGKRSKHPVGQRISDGGDTVGEYMSNIAGGRSDELDCVDCHDATRLNDGTGYQNHIPPGTGTRSAGQNPYMLKSVTTAGVYDGLCRTCHTNAGTTANGKVPGGLTLGAHADAGAGGPIVEDDGTVLRTGDPNGDGNPADAPSTQCTTCHDVHFSDLVKLFDSAIDGANCTAVCHYAGDNFGGYLNHGHGKPTSTYKYSGGVPATGASGNFMDMGMACTSCHLAMDTTETNPAFRKAHVENPITGAKHDDYEKRFNLNRNVQSWDNGSVFGNPEWGVCIDCHSSYSPHTSVEGDIIGCQDCHDEHGEGSGPTSNVFMIPEVSKANGNYLVGPYDPGGLMTKNGTEAVIYTRPRRNVADTTAPIQEPYTDNQIEFYRNAAPLDGGICDNTECHGTSTTATQPGPLSTLMTTGQHSQGNQNRGIDCAGCHPHLGDAEGGFRASASCTDCHNLNGRTHGDGNESVATHNTVHSSTSPFINGCDDCHSHDGSVTPGTGDHGTGTVNFGGPRLAATLNYSAAAFPSTGCNAANGCHDDNDSPNAWSTGTLACADCHDAGTTNVVDAGKILDQGGYPSPSKSSQTKHSVHLANTAYVGGSCDDCHGATAATGGQTGHKDNLVTVAGKISIHNVNNTCTNTCHATAVSRDWTNGGTLVCMDCHTSAQNYVGDNGGLYLPATGLHAIVPTISGVTHDDSFAGAATCTTCHTGITPLASHINGTWQADANPNTESRGLFATYTEAAPGTCSGAGVNVAAGCHSDNGAWGRRWSDTADDGPAPATAALCANCHGDFTSTFVSGMSERHGGPDPGGQIQANHTGGAGPCTQCHVFDTAVSYPAYTWATNHRDSTIQLNDQNSFVDEGATGTVRCDGCHTTPYGLADGQHSFRDTMTGDGQGVDRWGRAFVTGPAGDCAGCHDTILTAESGVGAHLGVNESLGTHDTVHSPASPYITACSDCHTNNGPGHADHNNGTVNFEPPATGKLSNTLNYLRTATFATTSCGAVNDCHNTNTGDWVAGPGSLVCLDCHTGTYLGGGANAPTSGLHAVTPSITAERHDDSFMAGSGTCTSCHTTLTAQATHVNGTFTGNGSIAGDRTAMGLFAAYTTAGSNNNGSCATTACHTGFSDDWAHQWNSTAGYYTNATTACDGCHGDWANSWNTGVIHRTSAGAQSMHGTGTTYQCKDCHTLEATANNYTFTFSTLDWNPLNATSEHGDGSIQVNNNGTGPYNATSGLCVACHSVSDGTHNFLDTSWPIVNLAGDAISAPCGACHNDGSVPPTSGAHAIHLNSGRGAAWTDTGDYSACIACHGDNGDGYTGFAGTHNNLTVNVAGTGVTYSNNGTPGTGVAANDDTCTTTTCHSPSGNNAVWGDTGLAWTGASSIGCRDCHYYEAAPIGANNLADPNPISASHGDHFDRGKLCTQCHGTNPTNETHITNRTGANDGAKLTGMANALLGEATLNWTHASAVTDYTYNTTEHSCYSATNNGLGCHATGGAAGAADVSRPDWDTSFLSTNCTQYCHTNKTTAAVNPTSGLHSVVPSITAEQHDESFDGATANCQSCHTTLTAQATHQNGAFTGNGSVAGDRLNMGLFAAYTSSGSDNSGSCATTACHTGFSDDWAHQWNSTAGYYTGATTSCKGCHGDWANSWNTGVIHRTSAGALSMHGTGTTYNCKDCHTLEATANNYTFTFSTLDWNPLNATSEHGDGSIQVNNNGTGPYNATSGLCVACHSVSDGTHNFLDTSWPIANIAGDAISAPCGACHNDGTVPPTSGAHAIHLNSGRGAAWTNTGDYSACIACHGDNGDGYTGFAGTHNNLTVNVAGTGITYSNSGTPGTGVAANDDTCITTVCHSPSGNNAVWGDTGLAWTGASSIGCRDCHYYEAAPVGANNLSDANPLSTSHSDHFDRGKLCTQCHGTNPTNETHITNRTGANDGAKLTGMANALLGEATLNWTHASAVTDYTYNTTEHSCYSATNNGLGCHATGGAAGAADVSRPDWDTSFLSTNCTQYCHTNKTTAAVNPTSGLHSVVPSISAEQHDESFMGGSGNCQSCHTTLTAQATHQNGAFTGNGSIASNRTNMGLFAAYTSSGSDNSGSCATTACHTGFSDDWAHQWNSTAGYYTNATTACKGCHGDWANSWNTGVIHRTSAGAQSMHGTGTTYECKDCHTLEATANNYTFTFGTTDWNPLNATSEHGDGNIQINSNGPGYNSTSGLCTTCHSVSDGTHNFLDTSWPIALLAGDTINAGCNGCHGYPPLAAGDPNTAQYADFKVQDYNFAGGAHGKNGHVPFGSVSADAWGPCGKCHDNGGSHVMATPVSGNRGNVTVIVDPAYEMRNTTGGNDTVYNGAPTVDATYKTCDNVSCHYGQSPDWAMRQQVVPDSVTLQGAADVSGATVLNGSSNNNMLTFQLRVSTTNDDGLATLGSVDVTFSGTTSSNVTAVSLWNSAGTVQYGTTGSWTANVATVPVSGAPNITTTATTFLVRYSIAAGAANGNTVAAEVTGIGFSSTDNLVAGTPTTTGASSSVLVDTLTGVVIAASSAGAEQNTFNASVDTVLNVYATASYSVSGSVDVTGSATWSTPTNASGGVWDANGQWHTGLTDGTDTIRVDYGGFNDTATVTVASSITIDNTQGFETATWNSSTNTGTVDANGFGWYEPAASTGSTAYPDWYTDVSTASGTTGPTGPHTGTYFLYAEASSTPSVGNFWALDSQGLSTTLYGTGMKVSFWYHMYGVDTPNLSLQISKDGGAFTNLFVLNAQVQTAETEPWLSYTHDLSTELSGVTNYTLRFRKDVITTGYYGDASIDDIHVWNTGAAGPAPPTVTGGPTATACDTCHQFGPLDDALDAGGHPTTGLNGPEYTYSAPGDHIKHGFGDPQTWTPPAPGAADASGTCTICHGAGVTSYTNDHTNGVKNMAAAGQISGGTWRSAQRDCTNVSCHNGNTTPVWGVGSTTCTSCHNNGTNDGNIANAWPATFQHQRHAGAKPTYYGFACTQCHPDNTGGHSAIDGSVSVTFAAGLSAGGTWSGTGTKQCSATYCHGGATADWDGGTGGACGDCHGAAGTGRPTTPVTGGGHTTGSGATSHSQRACADCHTHNGTNTTEHVNGPANANGDALVSSGGAQITSFAYGSNLGTDADGYRYSGGSCTPSCHSAGTWGGSGGCDFCHGYPPNGSGGSTNHLAAGRTGSFGSTDAAFYANHGVCETCHGVAGNTTPPTLATARTIGAQRSGNGGENWNDAWHNDGMIQMNGYNSGSPANPPDDDNVGYNEANNYCTNSCHTTGERFTSVKANTVDLHEFGAAACATCHDNGTGPAPQVNASSTHVDADGAGGTYTAGTCEDCHPFHSGGANIATIPNNATVGINYTSHGALYLGGAATTTTFMTPGVATEAEICWACHTANSVDGEWGINTDTNGTLNNYDFGTLIGGASWVTNAAGTTGRTWNSGRHAAAAPAFAYKANPIASTHTANPTTDPPTGSPGLDPVADIRCSYCHDVHSTYGPTGGNPYELYHLRGTWMGNPYNEDGAPQSGQTFGNTASYGAVPRGSTETNRFGGYFIDQNSGNPTASAPYNTLANTAGLCTLCHGTDVNNMNYYGTASTDWVGTNGHSNAVLGGTGTNAKNIFNGVDRNPSGITTGTGTASSTSGNADMTLAYNSWGGFGNTSARRYGMRGSGGGGYRYLPRITANYAASTDRWGVVVANVTSDTIDTTGTTRQTAYHKFPCSKCHNPHASRLPRLMITNCLDTKHNTWDDVYASATAGTDNSGRRTSNYTSAQNCHRVGNPAESGTGAGWNNVTPW